MAYSATLKVYRRGPGLWTVTMIQEDVVAQEVTVNPDDPAGDGSQPAIPRRGRIIAHRHYLESGAASFSPRMWTEVDGERFLIDAEDEKITHGPDEPPIFYDCLDGDFVWVANPKAGTASKVMVIWHLAAGWGTEHPEDAPKT